MKAQAEMIVVIGIIVLAVVAVLSALQQSSPSAAPADIAQRQKAVKNSFTTLATSGAQEILRIMSEHGGYLTSDVIHGIPHDAVSFLGKQVAYWQQCENDISPTPQQLQSWMQTGMEAYIKKHITSLVKSYDAVTADVSQLAVRATIHDAAIDFSITLPMTVKGYALQGPHTITIPTRFGRIQRFARDMAAEAASSRFLEYHALASMQFSSPAADGEPVVPTTGFLQDCGQTIYRSPHMLANGMKDVVAYTLSATLFWQSRPTDLIHTPVYSIPTVNGNTYADIEPQLFLPDMFSFDFSSPIAIRNNDFDYTFFWPFNVPLCQLGYAQKYNVDFPVITMVSDELAGTYFAFASKAAIADLGTGKPMGPGSCTMPPAAADACDSLDCSAQLTVTDGLGNPLPGTHAFFDGCLIGTSDADGVVQGPVQCGSGELSLYHSEQYDYFSGQTNAATLHGATYTLPIKPLLTVNVLQLKEDCSVAPVDTELVMSMLTAPDGSQHSFTTIDPSFSGHLNCTQQTSPDCLSALQGGTRSTVTMQSIPAGTYKVTTWVTDPAVIGNNPGESLPPLMVADVPLTIPHTDSATLTYIVPSSERPLAAALACLDGPGTATQAACDQDSLYRIRPCPATGCPASGVSKSTRTTWTGEYFFNATYSAVFTNLLLMCNKNMFEVI